MKVLQHTQFLPNTHTLLQIRRDSTVVIYTIPDHRKYSVISVDESAFLYGDARTNHFKKQFFLHIMVLWETTESQNLLLVVMGCERCSPTTFERPEFSHPSCEKKNPHI